MPRELVWVIPPVPLATSVKEVTLVTLPRLLWRDGCRTGEGIESSLVHDDVVASHEV